jgi:hypothetical protein
MPLAQVIRFDERQAIGRVRRKLEKPTGVVLPFTRFPGVPLKMPTLPPDDDQIAGRGRDPG